MGGKVPEGLDMELLALDRLAIRVANEVEAAAKVNGADGGTKLLKAYALASALESKMREAVIDHMGGGKPRVAMGLLAQVTSHGVMLHERGEWHPKCPHGEDNCIVREIAGRLHRHQHVPEGRALDQHVQSFTERIIGRIEGEAGQPVEVLVARAYGDQPPPNPVDEKQATEFEDFEVVFGLWIGHTIFCHEDVCGFEQASEQRAWPQLRETPVYGAEMYALERVVRDLCNVLVVPKKKEE